MITINISDVSNEEPDDLRRIAAYLMDVAEQRVPLSAVSPEPTRSFAPFQRMDVSIVPPVPPFYEPTVEGTAPVVAPPASSAPGVELDSRGLPWDTRIHSETKNRNGDGSWRNRRNLDKTILADVEAELRGVMGAGVPNTAVVPSVPVPPVPTTDAPDVPTTDAPDVPTTDAPDVPTTLPPTADTFSTFMAYVTPLMTAGKITTAQLIDIVKVQGLPHVGALSKRPDLIEVVKAAVDGVVA